MIAKRVSTLILFILLGLGGIGSVLWTSGGDSPTADPRHGESHETGDHLGEPPAPPELLPASLLRRTESPIPKPIPKSAYPVEEIFDLDKAKDCFEAFQDLGKTDLAMLEAAVEKSLKGEHPEHVKTAALRALLESGSPKTENFFAGVLQEAPDVSVEGRESVPGFAVQLLGRNALREPEVRRIIENAVWGNKRPLSKRLRRVGAVFLAQSAHGEDWPRLAACLAMETDAVLVERVYRTFEENPPPERDRYLFLPTQPDHFSETTSDTRN